MDRRKFLVLGSTGVAASTVLASTLCAGQRVREGERDDAAQALPADGRLKARPRPAKLTLAAGTHAVAVPSGREAQLLVPAKVASGAPAALAVMLHGAGGSTRGPLRWAGAAAEETGTILLVPKSQDGTWDLLHDGYGPDVAFIDECLAYSFGACNVDPKRLALGGFSDGASYAISLGLINGDLFSHIVAFSPGFVGSAEPYGNPPVFISHGTQDEILPIEQTSRRIVPALKKRGYAVTFKEFTGPHTVPPEIALEALAWVAGASLGGRGR